ncbi:ABC transporter permease [Poriferisphaera sp. WC338]|uniref:ABC transporter permease n=1 Tax=Poriferisphaera sp. WC338 TaxID=3425129 RepID=UPI003D812DC5
MKRNWVLWLIVLLVAVVSGEGLSRLMQAQDMWFAGEVVAWIGRIFSAFWIIKGLRTWRDVSWVKQASMVVVATLVAGMAYLFFQTVDMPAMRTIIAGIYAMSVGFFLGLQLIKLLLSGGHPVIGVARTLVDEAIWMRVPLVFMVILVLLVPILPFAIDSEDFLKYRIQTFLTASMIVVSIMLSLMTIFLAVGSVTNEMSFRQIYLSLTKPLSRTQYLLGKWLGIGLLNLLLVAVCGVAVYSFTTMLSWQTPRDALDAEAVHEQILVARRSQRPMPLSVDKIRDMYESRIKELRKEDPDVYGAIGSPISNVRDDIRTRVQDQVKKRWYSLPPRETKTFIFSNLQDAKNYEQDIQLRIHPNAQKITIDDMVLFDVRINGRQYVDPNTFNFEEGGTKLADNHYHVLNVPSDWISEDGRLEVTFGSMLRKGTIEQSTITFKSSDGIGVLYRVGTFEANVVKSFTIIWLRLLFLAMLSLAAGSMFSFPVAMLFTLLIYIAAASSEFIFEALKYYAPFPRGEMGPFEWCASMVELFWERINGKKPFEDGFHMIIRLVGQTFMNFIPRFGYYNPTSYLADGIIVPMKMLYGAFLWLGIIWTGLVGLIGLYVFRKREIARVTV